MKKLFILLLLSGCYTAKKADQQVTKAQLYHPEVVAKKAALWYPCKPTSTGIDSSEYKEWLLQMEELNNFYASIIPDSVHTYEVIKDTVLIEKIKQVQKEIIRMKSSPPVVKTITLLDSAGNYTKQQNIDRLQKAYDVEDKKNGDLKEVLLWLVIALAVSVIINIIQAKFK